MKPSLTLLGIQEIDGRILYLCIDRATNRGYTLEVQIETDCADCQSDEQIADRLLSDFLDTDENDGFDEE